MVKEGTEAIGQIQDNMTNKNVDILKELNRNSRIDK